MKPPPRGTASVQVAPSPSAKDSATVPPSVLQSATPVAFTLPGTGPGRRPSAARRSRPDTVFAGPYATNVARPRDTARDTRPVPDAPQASRGSHSEPSGPAAQPVT